MNDGYHYYHDSNLMFVNAGPIFGRRAQVNGTQMTRSVSVTPIIKTEDENTTDVNSTDAVATEESQEATKLYFDDLMKHIEAYGKATTVLAMHLMRGRTTFMFKKKETNPNEDEGKIFEELTKKMDDFRASILSVQKGG